jgi:thermitase
MTNHSDKEHLGWRRQLLVMATVLLGAMLLLVGFLPPQVAEGKQQEQIPTPPQVAQGEQQQEQNAAPPAPGTEQAQNQEELVLDEDPQGNEYVAGELLVTYEKGASKQTKEEAPKKVGAKVKKDFPEIGVQHVSVPEVKNEQAQAARQKALERKKKDLEQAPDVEAVDYNYIRRGTMTPSDPRYGEQWGFPKINAPAAWDTTQGSSNVRIAILDSGIDMNHPDLTGKVVYQYDFVGNDADATDDRGHGTHVAGTVAARTNNKDASGNYVGVAGTCPNCSLVNFKVLDANNVGTDANYVSAINFATRLGTKKPHVINMSFTEKAGSSALEAAINNAWAKGIVVVASAGNNGTDGTKYYPAAYQNVIAVAATDRDDKRAIFENKPGEYMVTVYTSTGSCCLHKYYEASNAGPWVDVAAPGKGIMSTTPTYASTCMPSCYAQNYDGTFNGTSMAAPHVSGLAGLILSKDGSLSPDQVRNQIESTAKDLGTAGRDDVFGNGLINAQAALNFTSRSYEENDAAITYSAGDWTKYSWSGTWGGASGGYTNWASRAGATATFTFTGNSFSWWANKGSYGGRGIVFVDGAPVGHIVDHYATSNQPSQAVFTKSWPTSGTHTVKIKVEGTSGRPWVDVDRFYVTQPK